MLVFIKTSLITKMYQKKPHTDHESSLIHDEKTARCFQTSLKLVLLGLHYCLCQRMASLFVLLDLIFKDVLVHC